MFHTSSGWLRLWCQREEVALWETASRAPFLSKSWIDYLFHQQLNYQKLFSCCRFNHPPVFMSLFSKNVLILPLSTASASCAAVPQVCSQGAAILFSSFSSPRDQNTVQARCSEVCWRWNRTGAPLYLLCLLKSASSIWPKVESRCWAAWKYLQRWRYWGKGVGTLSPHIRVPLVWPWGPLSLESHCCSSNDNPSKSNISKVLIEARSC